MTDSVGLDSRMHNTGHLHETLGERFLSSSLLVKYVKARRLGRESRKGFYGYGETGNDSRSTSGGTGK